MDNQWKTGNKEFQDIQDKFCHLGRFFAYCLNENGERMTRISGKDSDIEILKGAVSDEQLYELFNKMKESVLEDQIVEDTAYDNLKIAAIGYKLEGRLIYCWLAYCVLSPKESVGNRPVLTNIKRTTTEKYFYETVDFLRLFVVHLNNAKNIALDVEVEKQKSKTNHKQMAEELRRSEYFTSALQLLDSEEAFEKIAEKILMLAGSYVEVSAAQLIKIDKTGDYIEVLIEWLNEGITSSFDRTKGIERPGILKGDKPVIISSSTIISNESKEFLKEIEDKAFLAMPLFINGNVEMYVCFDQKEEERAWQLEEIRFIKGLTKILQSILTKRIQKNSLASSYASLQTILDNVGCCVFVQDIETKNMIFKNKQLKAVFEQEIKEGTLEHLITTGRRIGLQDGFYEIHHAVKKRFYDMRYTYIPWIDGSKVALCALYDITDKKIYQNKIEQQAFTDFLTGLYNRMCCERDLSMQLDKVKHSEDKNVTGALLYLDLDDFKHINDGLGHQYGDVLLKSISNNLKRIDGISANCYRMGGDEFVIIIPPENYYRFEKIIEDIQEVFSKPWFLKDSDYYCTMSMGIVQFPDDGDDVQDLIKKADIAMYEAKRSGKNCLARYSDHLSSSANRRLDMEKNMRDASIDGYKEFEVYYQPIVDIRQKPPVCFGAEALIRWNSSAMGFLAPSDFIPLAEYLGLINPIGSYVMREACLACKNWNESGKEYFKVNVNLSVVQLLQPDIVENIESVLKETSINPANLTLEVTESLAINDMKRMKEILNRIRGLGVRIALDDFGTGYSSLNHIREIPLDVIKVDQNFVQDLANDSYSQSFIKMVAELADAIGVNVCVEGIETKAQIEVIENMKVQLVQGYYFDRPLTKEVFEDKYVYRP